MNVALLLAPVVATSLVLPAFRVDIQRSPSINVSIGVRPGLNCVVARAPKVVARMAQPWNVVAVGTSVAGWTQIYSTTETAPPWILEINDVSPVLMPNLTQGNWCVKAAASDYDGAPIGSGGVVVASGTIFSGGQYIDTPVNSGTPPRTLSLWVNMFQPNTPYKVLAQE